METKSIQSLELMSISLATECLIDLYSELSGSACVCPIDVQKLLVYSDSIVALTWINSYNIKLAKMQKRSVFVPNRLTNIAKCCEIVPIQFAHVSGIENPADCVTRTLSHKQLTKSKLSHEI